MTQRLDQENLQRQFGLHAKYLRGQPRGQRLILRQHDGSKLNFSRRDLSWAVLSGCTFSHAYFAKCKLVGVDFFTTNLQGADLRFADLSRADLRGVNLRNANLEGATLESADIRNGSLMRPDDEGNLKPQTRGVTELTGANLSNSNFASARLSGVFVTGTDLSNANFRGARLIGTDFSSSDLRGANFAGADLSGAVLANCALNGANLNGANLTGTDLDGADLTAALFSTDALGSAQLDNTVLPRSIDQLEKPVQQTLRDHFEWVQSLGHSGVQAGLVRQANWQKVGGASPPERRSNRTTFLREPCVGSREGAGEASVAAWMGRAIEHRKSDGPGCRGFQIGRRQYRRRRFGEMSASPAVSENPCTFARLLLGPWEVFKLPRLS